MAALDRGNDSNNNQERGINLVSGNPSRLLHTSR